MAFELFKMVASLVLDKKDFDDGLKEAEQKASGLGGVVQKSLGVAGTAYKILGVTALKAGKWLVEGGKGIYQMTSNVADYGDWVDEMSQKLGVSTDYFQKWNAVLEQNGSSMAGMQGAFKNLASLITGPSDKQLNSLTAMGMAWEDIADLSREDAFNLLIERLRGIEDETKRAAIATDLFGGAGTQLAPILNMTAEEVQAVMDKTEELGGIMEDAATKDSASFMDAMDNMSLAMNGVKMAAVQDLMPGITSVMNGLSTLLSGGDGSLTQITAGIRVFAYELEQNIPEIATKASNIIDTLLHALNETAPRLIEVGLDAIVQIGMGILENLPMLAQTAMTILTALVNGIAEHLPTLIPAVVSIIMEMVRVLTDPGNLEALLTAALQIIVALGEGLINSVPELIRVIPDLIKNLVQALIAEIPQLIACALELIIALAMGLIEAIPELITAIPEIMQAIVDGLMDGIGDIISTGKDLIKGLWEGIKSQATFVWERLKEWWNDLLGKFKNLLGIHSPSTVFGSIGENLIQGLWDGIKRIWTQLTSWFTNAWNGLVSGVKGFLGIKSPSKVFAGIGENMALGVGEGWKDAFGDVKNAIERSVDFDSAVAINPAFAIAGNAQNTRSYAAQEQRYQGELLAALRDLKNLRVVMDTGETVGVLSGPMNGALGNQYIYRKRGVL